MRIMRSEPNYAILHLRIILEALAYGGLFYSHNVHMQLLHCAADVVEIFSFIGHPIAYEILAKSS